MCKWGTNTVFELTIPARLSHTGVELKKTVEVDSCIAPIVRALNEAGAITVASCCGHGKRPGNIALADGREIVIVQDYNTGRMVDAYLNTLGFGPINEFIEKEIITP